MIPPCYLGIMNSYLKHNASYEKEDAIYKYNLYVSVQLGHGNLSHMEICQLSDEEYSAMI